jgi:DivIVA domain-containing protein
MPLTPAHVRGVAFSKPPIGKRGYHEDEVDTFLDVVEAELARLLAENTDLRTRLEQGDQQPTPDASDTAATPPKPASPAMRQPPSTGEDNYHHRAARVLNLAQQMADRITTEAQAEADALLSQAHTRAEQLLHEVQATVEGLISEATTRAETVVHDAHTLADTREQQSRDKVASQQEELHQHTEIITALRGDKTALENSVEHLHAFETDYRTHLTRFLRAQLQQLDAQQPAGPADPISAQHAPPAAASGTRPEASPPQPSPDKPRWRPAVGA